MTDFFLIAPSRTKRAVDVKPYTVDLKAYLRSYWIAGRRYNSGDYVRAPTVPGFAYQATAVSGGVGESGQSEPAWPRVLAATVSDGSLTWTAVAPGTLALDSISSVTWSQLTPPDAQLTIGSAVNTVEEASAKFSGGTAGFKYRVRCAATTAGGYTYNTDFDLEIA